MTDITYQIKEALEGYHKDHRAFGAEIARDSLGLSACDLLPKAVEEIKRLEAKLAMAVGALGKLSTAQCFGNGETVGCRLVKTPIGREVLARMEFARATLTEIKGERDG